MLAAPSSTNVLECLRIFARRDLPAFHGLAQRTNLDDVAAVFDLDRSWRGEGVLGSECRHISWLGASAPGFGQGIRVWADDDDVPLLDATDVELPDGPAPVLETLGEPDVRFDSYLGMLKIERSEWVYPRRGLTLYINPGNGVLFRIAAFAPTDLETYRRNLRLDLKMRRLPLRDVEGNP